MTYEEVSWMDPPTRRGRPPPRPTSLQAFGRSGRAGQRKVFPSFLSPSLSTGPWPFQATAHFGCTTTSDGS